MNTPEISVSEIPDPIKTAMNQQDTMLEALERGGAGKGWVIKGSLGRLTKVESYVDKTVIKIGTGQRIIRKK